MPLQIDEARDDRDNHIAQVHRTRSKPGVTLDQAQPRWTASPGSSKPSSRLEQGLGGHDVDAVYDWIVSAETRAGALRAARRGRLRAADRLRERRQPDAGAGRRAAARDRAADGDRRGAPAAGPAGADRRHACSRPAGRRRRRPARLLERAGCCGSGCPRRCRAPTKRRSTRPVLLFSLGRLHGHRPRLRAAAGARRLARRRGRDAQGRWRAERRRPVSGSRQALAAGQVALATVAPRRRRAARAEPASGCSASSSASIRRRSRPAMIGLPADRYEDSDASWAFYERLLERLAAAPGCRPRRCRAARRSAAATPACRSTPSAPSRLGDGAAPDRLADGQPGLLSRAMRIPLLRGSALQRQSGRRRRAALIVSAAMARRIWGDDDPVGRQIKAGPNGVFTRRRRRRRRAQSRSLDSIPRRRCTSRPAHTLWPTMTIIVRGTSTALEAAGARCARRRSRARPPAGAPQRPADGGADQRQRLRSPG